MPVRLLSVDGGSAVKEVGYVHTQDTGDLQQGGDFDVHRTGLDLLIRGAGDSGLEEHPLLGHVLAQTYNADAVADGAAFVEEPGVVVGQAWHSTHAGLFMIDSQPGAPGFL